MNWDVSNQFKFRKNSWLIWVFGEKMEIQTESLLQQDEKVEVERELSSLVETTLKLEYELELAIKLKENN